MHAKAQAILKAIGFFCATNAKAYCYPSQETLLRVLDLHYGEPMARSTLNVHLSRLEQGRFFERVRRHRRGIEGAMIFCSTLYKFKGKAIKLLYQLYSDGEYLFRFFRVRSFGQYSKDRQVSIRLPASSSVLVGTPLPPIRGHPTPLEVKNTSFKEKAPYLPQNYMNPEDYWRGKG